MSIRFLKSDNTIGTATNIKDLFDPRVNDLFPDSIDQDEHKWEKMRKILNVLFCKENIEDYEFFKYFVLSGSPNTEEEHQNFVILSKDVPPDQRYLFTMMCKENPLVGSTSRLNIPKGFFGKDISSSYAAFDLEWARFDGLDAESFVTKVNAAHQIFTTEFFGHRLMTERTPWRVANTLYANAVLATYLNFTTGQNVISSANDSCNAYSLLSSLQQDPETNYKVTFRHDNRSVKLVILNIVTKSHRKALYSILCYSADALQILPYPNMMPKEKDPILVGVELEVSTDYQVRDVIDAADEPFFLAKSDSSISGCKRNAMELVTAPSSFKYLKKQYALWFNKLDYSKFDTTTETNNGMHVHIGREHFEDNTHIRNFCWFFNNPANTDFLLYISERTRDSLMRWAPAYIFPDSYTRTYAFRHVYELIGSGFRGITNFKGGWHSAKTVEVRMFRGVVSYAAIVKNLEFVEAIFHFTKGLSSYRQMTLSSFFKWLATQPNNKYILLRKFIGQTNTKKFLITSDIRDVIFNQRDPEKILAILEKSSLKLTNDHITYLNKGHKRTFILDKATGKVSLTHHNKSKLAGLDKSFAERYLRDLPAA